LSYADEAAAAYGELQNIKNKIWRRGRFSQELPRKAKTKMKR